MRRCLGLNKKKCHQVMSQAYLACFDVLHQARRWLQRTGRIPSDKLHKAVKAKRLKLSSNRALLPPALARSARLACAQSYSRYSVACHRAHRRTAVLCTRLSSAHCGTSRLQARMVCARAEEVGRQQCDGAWTAAEQAMKGASGRIRARQGREHRYKQVQRAQMQAMARAKVRAANLRKARQSGMVARHDTPEMQAFNSVYTATGVYNTLAQSLEGQAEALSGLAPSGAPRNAPRNA